jgi:hypothetical protein
MIPNKTQFLSELQVDSDVELDVELETSTEPNQFLRKFVEHKSVIKSLSEQLSEIESDAIVEALQIHQDNMNNNKNNVIYQDSIAKVVICFRQKYVSSKDSPELAKLEELIRSEEIIILKRNGEKLNKLDSEIEELENQIKALEVRKEKLLSSKRIESLKAEYQQLIQELAYKEPGLNVSFKR